MASRTHPSEIAGGCLCESVRYTVSFSKASDWPPYCSSCQCTKCRKWLSSLQPIALSLPTRLLSLPSPDSKDPSQLKVYNSSPGCKRAFCGKCGSGLTFQNEEEWPGDVELWIGTLDEEVLIGKPKAETKAGEKVEREGGLGKEICVVKESLFWENKIDGVTDQGPSGKKWWGMIGDGTPFY